MKTSTLESMARALTIFSFVLLCWVAHRALQVRETCISSSFIAHVLVDGIQVDNCSAESRLNLRTLTSPLTREHIDQLRQLEVLEPLATLFKGDGPSLTVELSRRDPRAFEIAPRALRLGLEWLSDSVQVRRALVMALLKRDGVYNQFQMEVLADFLLLAVYQDGVLHDGYSLRHDVKFPTAAPSLNQYCQSPFRSLAHYRLCQLPDPPTDGEAVWGFRPLLAAALWRAFDKLPLQEQIHVLDRVRESVALPVVGSVEDPGVESLVEWFSTSLNDYADNLGISKSAEGQLALKRTLKELDVEAPTHWELTVDVTKTPAWKEIVEQLKSRSRFRVKERALVFTPEGEVALPSGLKVAWTASDIQSQKHVMIACQWPQAGEAVHVQARQIYARKSCEKLSGAFWD
ncbi:MAG: hypothetical protein KF799_00865 [Bdellovibrionales bacterium]|nr:hypothetical protein [Bdellovibrionales bacterium]